MLLPNKGDRTVRGPDISSAQLRPTVADSSIIDKVLPGAAGLEGGPHPTIFLRAQQQLTTSGTWSGLQRHPSLREVLKGVVRRCAETAINYCPPPQEEPVVGKTYSIGSDGGKLSGFTLVKLQLPRRSCPSQVVELHPSEFQIPTGVKEYPIEPGSSLQVLAIDSENASLWVRYDSWDGLWDHRFAPPGIIANISFLRFDRLLEAGRGDWRREQALHELLSNSTPKIERIQLKGQIFALGDQVKMPLKYSVLYKMRILNTPEKPAISLHRKESPDLNHSWDLGLSSDDDRRKGLSQHEHFWCGSGTPPLIGFDPTMNVATIVRFSDDGTVALLRLDRPRNLQGVRLSLQEGALFPLPTQTGVFWGSAKYCYGLFQSCYLKPWYIRYPLASTTLPALDRCQIEHQADFFEYGPGAE